MGTYQIIIGMVVLDSISLMLGLGLFSYRKKNKSLAYVNLILWMIAFVFANMAAGLQFAGTSDIVVSLSLCAFYVFGSLTSVYILNDKEKA